MNTGTNVFFSYAWRDMGLAMRIDSDLRRSGVSRIWRDRVDAQPAENFREQYLKEIEHCSYFITLDSENYRIHSHWCKDEIDHFLKSKAKKPGKKLIVCLAQKPGVWRENELFAGQNLIAYIDFSTTDEAGCIYDNQGKYQLAIQQLCSIFGCTYQPWDEYDYERDFLDELKENSQLSEQDRICLLHDYECIRHYWILHHPTVEQRLRNFILDYEALACTSFFPYYLLGDYLSAKQDYEACTQVFLTAVRKCPDDPRGYRWLGTSFFYSGKYDDALYYYEQSLKYSEIPKNKREKTHLRKVCLNIIRTYIARSDYTSALLWFTPVEQSEKNGGEEDLLFYKYQSVCYLALGMQEKNREILTQGLNRFPNHPDLYELMGHYYLKQSLFRKAERMYQKAIENSISVTSHLNCYASMANACRIRGHQEKLKRIAETITEYASAFSSQLTDEDSYYIGNVYFYAGNETLAKEYLDRCRLPGKIGYH